MTTDELLGEMEDEYGLKLKKNFADAARTEAMLSVKPIDHMDTFNLKSLQTLNTSQQAARGELDVKPENAEAIMMQAYLKTMTDKERTKIFKKFFGEDGGSKKKKKKHKKEKKKHKDKKPSKHIIKAEQRSPVVKQEVHTPPRSERTDSKM